jgi:large subunit ribosomal protein L24
MAQAKYKIRKGDKVIVLAGKDKGKRGEVIAMLRSEGRAIVSGVNLVKRHTRPSPQGQGGIIEKEAPIHVSNLAIEDPKTGQPTRVGYKILEDGRKVRIARRSGEVIDG